MSLLSIYELRAETISRQTDLDSFLYKGMFVATFGFTCFILLIKRRSWNGCCTFDMIFFILEYKLYIVL